MGHPSHVRQNVLGRNKPVPCCPLPNSLKHLLPSYLPRSNENLRFCLRVRVRARATSRVKAYY